MSTRPKQTFLKGIGTDCKQIPETSLYTTDQGNVNQSHKFATIKKTKETSFGKKCGE